MKHIRQLLKNWRNVKNKFIIALWETGVAVRQHTLQSVSIV